MFSKHIIKIAYDYFNYDTIEYLLVIFETGSKNEKLAVLKSFSRLVTLKTLRCLIISLNSTDEDFKTAASQALTEILPDKFAEFSGDFEKWNEFYKSFASLPNYEEIS